MLIKYDSGCVQGSVKSDFAQTSMRKCTFPIKKSGVSALQEFEDDPFVLFTTQEKLTTDYRTRSGFIGRARVLSNALMFYRARPCFIERAQVLSSALRFYRTRAGRFCRAGSGARNIGVGHGLPALSKWPISYVLSVSIQEVVFSPDSPTLMFTTLM